LSNFFEILQASDMPNKRRRAIGSMEDTGFLDFAGDTSGFDGDFYRQW